MSVVAGFHLVLTSSENCGAVSACAVSLHRPQRLALISMPWTACSDAPRSHAVPEVRQSTAPQFFDWHAFIKFLSPPEFVRSLAEAKKHVRAGSDTPEVASKRPRS